ncbi:hypothetical protein PoB_003961800 [Plakobranchus ocellatus]|uniref:Uncharacterized protein n=1 Tax=Plakobranchus ocellatus TaxID=259542 RepID=A0AAV4B1X0_9GAST|nr:hypothetical protein PoB_003961800 [Plakobranchus ocellatus]
MKVTFGQDPAQFFRPQPRTVTEAANANFKPVVGSDKPIAAAGACDPSPHYSGRAYVKDGDYSLTLLYDLNGFIAGIQAGIPLPDVAKQCYPCHKLRPPFVLDGIDNSRVIITAYFTDPKDICTVGRVQTEFDLEGTGDNLWLQTGMYPSNVTLIPKQQSQIGTPWVEGKCFPTMGKHYWYNTTKDMSCDEFYPVFLLYNGGQLNAFGWAFAGYFNSVNYEHPTAPVFPIFFNQIPDCLFTLPGISTMHIYLTDNPFINKC